MNQPLLNDFCKEVFENNKLKGFDVSKSNLGQTLMLIVSELSEALEADRKSNYAQLTARQKEIVCDENNLISFNGRFEKYVKDTFEDEIADSFIRLMDLVGGLNIDIDWHIEQKLKYNVTRKFKHGKAY